MATPALAAVTQAVQVVSRLVREQLAGEERPSAGRRGVQQAPVTARQDPQRQPAPSLPRVDDRTVTTLIGRMRSLERQEHFRHGYLR